MRNENGLKIGFAVESLDGHFLSQDGKWVKTDVCNAHMFLKSTAFAEEIISQNKISKCILHSLVKCGRKIIEDTRMLRVEPKKYKFITAKDIIIQK